jgi:hypothetical protein
MHSSYNAGMHRYSEATLPQGDNTSTGRQHFHKEIEPKCGSNINTGVDHSPSNETLV